MNLTSHQPTHPLIGDLSVPGDKSISHRAAILGGLAEGTTEISNFLCSEDCLHTLRAMEQLGARIQVLEEYDGVGPIHFFITGVGMSPLAPAESIDCGNSGTGMRLMAGMLAACPFESKMFGDASLSSRPMGRIIAPLTQMGASIEATGTRKGCAPLIIHGRTLSPIEYQLPVASAQVKSAILLAGMFASGTTMVIQPWITRDHTERLLSHFGIPCSVSQQGLNISITGPVVPQAHNLIIPGDISSAAFWMVAASIIPGSNLTLRKVGLNPTRTAILDVLQRMGAHMTINQASASNDGEPFGDITVRYAGPLHGTTIQEQEIPNLIDEIPILAIAASFAQGTTSIRHAKELRVKETDRIATTTQNLQAMGAHVEEFEDGMVIRGGNPLTGCLLNSFGDHRIAMSFLIAGLASQGSTTLEGVECIATSYPGFADHLAEALHE